jgi:hypothetical protein
MGIADEDVVKIDPIESVLRQRHLEPAGDELAGAKVEFANDIGIAAARTELDEAALIGRRQAIGAVPDPAFALVLTERVDIDEHTPLRCAGRKTVERGDPPQAARMVGVDPVIEHLIADDRVGHDEVGRIVEDGERALPMLFKSGNGRQFGRRLGVPLLDLGQRFRAVDIFQPKIRIGPLCHDGGGGRRGERENDELFHGRGR